MPFAKKVDMAAKINVHKKTGRNIALKGPVSMSLKFCNPTK